MNRDEQPGYGEHFINRVIRKDRTLGVVNSVEKNEDVVILLRFVV